MHEETVMKSINEHLASCGAEELRPVEALRSVMAERAGVDTAACYIKDPLGTKQTLK